MITTGLLKSVFRNTPETKLAEYVEPLNRLLPLHGINTTERIAAFLSQTGHESAGYSVREENLNYSADGLRRVFGKYFPTIAVANAYARQPAKIASRVYASRMGNGNEASQDGWRYRGKGLIQLTGKANHVAFAKWAGMSLEEAITYMLTPAGAVHSAVWFWSQHDLNELADKTMITATTKIINGGTNGLEERKALYFKFLRVLA